ncbi:MAG TPA: DUF4392 domain-containing protein [Symbiobacteriaceae bacterium]|nr:DUF4392 domain-containing protein [Symbiobacteriaceae bacterium]
MERIERIIARDPGNRGMGALVVPGDLEAAARALTAASKVMIATGFAVGPGHVAETDGPPGALFLARVLAHLGKTVIVATHRSCFPVMAAGLRALDLSVALEVLAPGEDPEPLFKRIEPDLVVTIELPGRAADGQYYSMRGVPVTGWTSPLDGLLPLADARSIPTVSVGDGGNEAGMGRVADRVRTAVPRGGLIAAVLGARHLVAAGTSNWGAYGLIAAVNPALLHTPEEETHLLNALVEAGAQDGVKLAPQATVDGLDPVTYLQVLLDLKAVPALTKGGASA